MRLLEAITEDEMEAGYYLFHRAAQRLGVAPPEAVFVGDHSVADIAGARGTGLKTIWKRDQFWEPPLSADGVIDHLSELESQLMRFMRAKGHESEHNDHTGHGPEGAQDVERHVRSRLLFSSHYAHTQAFNSCPS
jgi:hypothetical protein